MVKTKFLDIVGPAQGVSSLIGNLSPTHGVSSLIGILSLLEMLSHNLRGDFRALDVN